MIDLEDYFAYFILKTSDDNRPIPTFAFGQKDYVSGVHEKWTSDPETQPEVADAEDPSEPEFTHQSALTEALKASVDFGLAQHELIWAATVAPVAIRMAMARGDVIGPIKEKSPKIFDDEHCEIYGLSEAEYAEMISKYQRYDLTKKGVERFPSATLLSFVATFDTLVVDILSKMLRLQSDWLERSERTISLARLAAANSLDEIIQEQIAEEVYQFSRGSHSEQAGYIKRNFGIDIEKDWKRWPDYIEIFERRNLVAHGERNFNSRYVRICISAGHKGSAELLGKKVELTANYLRQSLNVLLEFAVLLSFSLFRKFVKEVEEQAFTNLNEAVFTLTQRGHYVVAERLASYALGLKGAKITSEIRLMLIVNRASAMRHDGREEEAKAFLEKEDWTAVSDLFKICVASVSGDVKKFEELLPKLNASGEINAHSLLTWPCFSFVRKDAQAQAVIKNVFNIDLGKEVSGDEAKTLEAVEGPPDDDGSTVH